MSFLLKIRSVNGGEEVKEKAEVKEVEFEVIQQIQHGLVS